MHPPHAQAGPSHHEKTITNKISVTECRLDGKSQRAKCGTVVLLNVFFFLVSCLSRTHVSLNYAFVSEMKLYDLKKWNNVKSNEWNIVVWVVCKGCLSFQSRVGNMVSASIFSSPLSPPFHFLSVLCNLVNFVKDIEFLSTTITEWSSVQVCGSVSVFDTLGQLNVFL